MFKQIGCFHFATDHRDPIGSLKTAWAVDPGVPGSLLVLPEAFNLGRCYGPGVPAIHRDVMIADLMHLALGWHSSFVVGILEPPPPSEWPHSSAYFVRAAESQLICHKEFPDGIGQYATCPVAPDHNNPVTIDGATIVSLICRDVENSSRCGKLAKLTPHDGTTQNLVCIPAAMSRKDWFGAQDNAVVYLSEFSGIGPAAHLIVANSLSDGVGSFIAGQRSMISNDWTVLRRVDDRGRNQIQWLLLG